MSNVIESRHRIPAGAAARAGRSGATTARRYSLSDSRCRAIRSSAQEIRKQCTRRFRPPRPRQEKHSTRGILFSIPPSSGQHVVVCPKWDIQVTLHREKKVTESVTFFPLPARVETSRVPSRFLLGLPSPSCASRDVPRCPEYALAADQQGLLRDVAKFLFFALIWPVLAEFSGRPALASTSMSALRRTDTEARMTTTYRLLALIEPAAPILMTALVVLVRVTT